MRVVKLSKLQIRSLFLSVLKCGPPPGDMPLSETYVFYLLLADMLENLQFLSSEQRLLIGELLRQTRNELGMSGAPCGDQLAFADGRYATWSGLTGWIVLESGDSIPQLPRPPLETIAYNLAELHRRGVQIIKSRNGLNVDNSAGSVEKQGDVCERPTDPVSG